MTPMQPLRLASMFTIFFTTEPIPDFDSAKQSNSYSYASFYTPMRDKKVYLRPINFECAMSSFPNTGKAFEQVLGAAKSINV